MKKLLPLLFALLISLPAHAGYVGGGGASYTSDAELNAIAGVTSAADKCLLFTGSGTAGVFTCTGEGRGALSLTDPNADRIMFWDDSAGAYAHLTAGSGLTITDTTITSAGGSAYFDDDGGTPGVAPSAAATDSISIGDSALVEATGTNGVAIGTNSEAKDGGGSGNNIAIGTDSIAGNTTDGTESIAVGPFATATETNSVAIGPSATVDSGGDNATAIGPGANAAAWGAVVIGKNVDAITNQQGIVIGSEDADSTGSATSQSSGARAITIGAARSSSSGNAQVIASGEGAIAIGSPETTGTGTTGTTASGEGAIAIGSNTANVNSARSTDASAAVAIAIGGSSGGGHGAQSDGTASIAIGGGASTAAGATASTTSAIALGGASTTGAGASATGTSGLALGGSSGTGAAASASGIASVAIGGNDLASASGQGPQATSQYAVAIGVNSLSDHYGQFARANGRFSATGDIQYSEFLMRSQTTNATPTEMTLDGSSSYITIASGQVMACTINIIGKDGSGNVGFYTRKVVIKNIGGTTSVLTAAETIGTDREDTAGWDVSVTADNTNDRLAVTVTGAAATSINWVARVSTVETR